MGKRQTEIILALIEAGADVNVTHHSQASILDQAYKWGNATIVQSLLEHGVDT